MKTLQSYGATIGYFIIAILLFFGLLIAKSWSPTTYKNAILAVGLIIYTVGLLYLGTKIIGVKFKEVSTFNFHLLFYFLVTVVTTTLLIYLFTKPDNVEFTWNSTILIALLNAFIVGLFEELVFRYTLLAYVVRKSSTTTTLILLSTLLFGLFHSFRVDYDFTSYYLVTTFILGFLLSISFVVTKNFLICIVIHAAINFSNAIMENYFVMKTEPADIKMLYIGIILLLLFLVTHHAKLQLLLENKLEIRKVNGHEV